MVLETHYLRALRMLRRLNWIVEPAEMEHLVSAGAGGSITESCTAFQRLDGEGEGFKSPGWRDRGCTGDRLGRQVAATGAPSLPPCHMLPTRASANYHNFLMVI